MIFSNLALKPSNDEILLAEKNQDIPADSCSNGDGTVMRDSERLNGVRRFSNLDRHDSHHLDGLRRVTSMWTPDTLKRDAEYPSFSTVNRTAQDAVQRVRNVLSLFDLNNLPAS